MQKLQSSYPSSTPPSTPPVFVTDDGRALPLMPVGDDWGCKARDLGRLLGYSADGKNLLRKITKDWEGDLLEGVDFSYEIAQVSETETPPPRPEVILTRSGINMVCILTRKPMGTKIRRWLAEDVMVQIAETGSYGQPDPIVTLTEALVPALNGITTALQSITSRLDALEKRSTTVEHTTTRIEHRAPEPQRQPVPRGRLYAPPPPVDGVRTEQFFEGTAQLGSAGVPSWGEWNLFGRQASFRVIVPSVGYTHHGRLKQLMWEAGVVRYSLKVPSETSHMLAQLEEIERRDREAGR